MPFDRPSRATLAASAKKVVAHWHALPNRYYSATYTDEYIQSLDPAGLGNVWLPYGGYLRSRPIRDPNAIPNPIPPDAASLDAYIRQGMTLDVEWAAEIGIDAFVMNFWYVPQDPNSGWRWHYELELMFDAADAYTTTQAGQAQPGFSIIPNFDGAIIGPLVKQYQLDHPGATLPTEINAEAFADSIASLTDRPSFMKIGNKYVIGIFCTECLPVQWLHDFRMRLLNHDQKEVYFLAAFGDPTSRDTYAAEIQMYGRLMSLPYTYLPEPNEITLRNWAYAQTPPLQFMQSVTPMADRAAVQWDPYKPVTLETGGFKTWTGVWMQAINDGAEWAYIMSWNDHSETTAVRPNTGTQYALYDLAAYYITWYKTGTQPAIVRDTLYYAHRMHKSNASYCQTLQTQAANPLDPNLPAPTQSILGVTLEDQIFLLGFLKDGGTLEIQTSAGTYSQSFGPGIQTLSAPLAIDNQPQFKLTVNGQTTINFASAFKTWESDAVVWQDLYYRTGSSSRSPVFEVQNNIPQQRWSQAPLPPSPLCPAP